MVVMIPLIQLLLFGYAINTDIRQIPIAVVDQSQSTAGRVIIESVKVTQVVDVVQRYATVQQAELAIKQGVVRAALIQNEKAFEIYAASQGENWSKVTSKP